ncbi:hypothetical protein GCM10009863_21180 [Streptomyces axinellae]|uniref:Uncharacterized protein n=1 Tax=Streptomyces axinellae TaxID=552788 RepID=A0ABN3Q0G1_9ACTN
MYSTDPNGYRPASSPASSWDEARGRPEPSAYPPFAQVQVQVPVPGSPAVEEPPEAVKRSVFEVDDSSGDEKEQGLTDRLAHNRLARGVNRAGHSLASRVRNNLPHVNRGVSAQKQQQKRQPGTGGAGQAVPGAKQFTSQQPNSSSALVRKPRGRR